MNIKEYISGGMVESYVLGLATEEERAEFERLCQQYPALLAARNEFEAKLEKQAFDQAIDPPGFIKQKILTQIQKKESNATEPNIIAMADRPRRSGWPRYVAAASVILFLASAYFAYDYYTKNERLQTATAQLQSRLDSLDLQMSDQKKMMDLMTNPSVTVVSMVGTQPNRSSADIYWDSTSTDVFMVVKNIPKLPSEKQYQLWAFIDGKPLDLGLFDGDKNKVMLKMKNTQKAEAFAITIEKRGNGPAPQGPVETMGKTDL